MFWDKDAVISIGANEKLCTYCGREYKGMIGHCPECHIIQSTVPYPSFLQGMWVHSISVFIFNNNQLIWYSPLIGVEEHLDCVSSEGNNIKFISKTKGKADVFVDIRKINLNTIEASIPYTNSSEKENIIVHKRR
jgi:hypothetical protein